MAVVNELGGCKDDGKSPMGADGQCATADGALTSKDNVRIL